MKTFTHHLLSMVFGLAVFLPINSQIHYSEGKIGINTEPAETSKDITVKDCNGMEWVNGENTILSFDLSKSTPSISSNGILTFKNVNDGKFLPVYADGLRTYSNNGGTKLYMVLEDLLPYLLRLTPVEINEKWGYIPFEPNAKSNSIGHDPADVTIPEYPLNGQIGFNVKELEKVLPKAVSYDAEGNSFIDYSCFIPLLVASVKELHTTVEAQAAAIQAMGMSQSPAASRQTNGLIKSCTPNPTSGLN